MVVREECRMVRSEAAKSKKEKIPARGYSPHALHFTIYT